MDSFSLPEKIAMNEEAIALLTDYIYECYDYMALPGSEFAYSSYCKWAANEMLERLIEFPLSSPFMIILEFYNKMEHFVALSKNKKDIAIFDAARDTAGKFLNLIN